MQGGIGGKNIILRLEISTEHIQFGQLITLVNEHGGDVIAIDVIRTSEKVTVRDITVTIADPAEIDQMIARIKKHKVLRYYPSLIVPSYYTSGAKLKCSPRSPFKTAMTYPGYIPPMWHAYVWRFTRNRTKLSV